ncbi:hippurate hydrolase [Sanguibacter gelidistatuariae]|uniref:Hippurate hydrolase n=1 Tax=Sanguibacter gelidistatuariae TaxID=1814289 RepID=A0A1G6GPF5_9MICO|nr:amidohydrolase [Sanguibacter gelidistatuariae]SDB83828.1 hippurate hydrolase [Sanguibacter gelidistatuariae]
MSIDLAPLYRDLHAHPELGFAEVRTAAIAAEAMRGLGLEVTTGVGGTGVVAVLANGPGPVVYLRADMDGLPVLEKSGVAYASTDSAVDVDGAEVPLMHACGHDVHVTCLIGATGDLVARRTQWSGTLVAVFQPAEELIAGAAAMLADGLLDRFPRPDVVLGQHVAPFPAGSIALHTGAAMAGADSMTVTFHGQGGHASRPHATIDPVLAACSAVVRLQSVVSREVEPGQLAVVTVGSIHAGTQGNIIPDDATIEINIRTISAASREHVLAAVRRILDAEASAAGMTTPPTVVLGDHAPATINDAASAERLRARFVAEFGPQGVWSPAVVAGSEDVGLIATAAGVPLVFWFLGGTDPEIFAAAAQAGTVDRDVPGNHSPFFAPVIEPTLSRGVAALSAAAREWFGQ